MSRFFYPTLAWNNLKKNRKTYIPYILTCIGTIAMFYMMVFISGNQGLEEIPGVEVLQLLLTLGSYIIGIFSMIFLFYTNSFITKQRQKEFGLYNILGMEKKHIAKMITWEAFYVAILSLVVGLITGIVVSRLMFLLLMKLLTFEIPFTTVISMQPLLITVILFSVIFLLTLLNNLRHIHLSKPIELLKGGEVGEKEPKTKWLIVLIGIIALSTGYYIALATESPLAALNKFFLAVLLVIVATYALFTAGTIALFKMLRKNKSFYYKTNHFISVSGMIYRMKQNAVGLANICVLSTMVLVMLSSTVCLYIGMEELIKNRYPKEIAVTAYDVQPEDLAVMEELIQEGANDLALTIEKPHYYYYKELQVIKNGNEFVSGAGMGYGADIGMIVLIPLSEYNRMENRSEQLAEDEVLLYTFRGEEIQDSITMFDQTFTIKEQLPDLQVDGIASAMILDSFNFVIVPDEETIRELDPTDAEGYNVYYGFDVDGDVDKEIALPGQLTEKLKAAKMVGHAEGAEESKEIFYSLYGGLFFLGIFLGTLFIMATVLIIYYKQISEGYQDKNRFEIMQKVGLSKDEIKKSIRSQVLLVFFLPLIAAVVHILFAFNVITKLLEALNLTNVGLFAMCTAGVIIIFAVFYLLVYLLTAREYYRIVSNN
ncbi:ABC transporter permease [Ornithinibacillus sp. BX22]|uniref:ABC transporter permease n=1 Tax=Ornithinibacillus hominis TaxID=2763055 RepID=A0A923L2Y0_9BACI|nr:ABC transporter permease [Ornithinibacillus hominis]MBC5635490.1 ABC transporter permease [Ornithinibacillus hominis]